MAGVWASALQGCLDLLRREPQPRTGGTLVGVSTRTTKLSQFCHGCGQFVPKPLWLRWHACPCGIGPIQRDLYSAFLAAYLDPADLIPSCARYQGYWEGREPGLRAAYERLLQRASAGQPLPRSFGIPKVRARLLESPSLSFQEPPGLLQQGLAETEPRSKEPPVL